MKSVSIQLQVSPFHPVSTRVSLSGLDGGPAGGFHVHEFPVPRRTGAEDNPCARTAGHFNPFNADKSVSPGPGEGSYDEYEVGDLSGKYGGLAGLEERSDGFVDPSLSLFGRYSVVGRYVCLAGWGRNGVTVTGLPKVTPIFSNCNVTELH